MDNISRSISIKFSVSTDILIDYQDIAGNQLFDTNKYGEYAQIFYRILASPVGMTEAQIENAGPDIGILGLEIKGRTFHNDQPWHKIAKEELDKIKDFIHSNSGKKSLKPMGSYWPRLDIKDLPLS